MSSGYFGQSDAPPPRQLGSELGQIGTSAGPLLGQERQFGQQVGQDQLGLDTQFLHTAEQAYPDLAGAERAATTGQRVQDRGDLARLGPGMERAIGAINPDWQRSLGQLNQAAGQVGQTTALQTNLNGTAQTALGNAQALAPSQLRTMLTQGATSDLALGRSLTPEEERDVQQASRAAYASRGIVNSDPALIGEVLARDSAGLARETQRRQYATAIQQLGQGEDAAHAQQFGQYAGVAQGVEGLNQQAQNAGRSFLTSTAGVNQQALAPVLGMFGQRTDVSPTAAAGMLGSGPNIIGAGSQAMSPLLGYGSDLFNTNFNSQAATNINNANNMAAIHGAIIGAVGNIAGGAAKACWVAREIFGEEMQGEVQVEKWKIFRSWLLWRAPKWFCNLYLRRGEEFALWLRRHRSVKWVIKPLMERVVMTHLNWLKPASN